MNNEIQDTIFLKWQSIAGGILSALIKYLPHLIGVTAIAVAGALFTINRAKETTDTNKVWQHSGTWHTNILDLQMEVSNLQVEVDEVKQTKGK